MSLIWQRAAALKSQQWLGMCCKGKIGLDTPKWRKQLRAELRGAPLALHVIGLGGALSTWAAAAPNLPQREIVILCTAWLTETGLSNAEPAFGSLRVANPQMGIVEILTTASQADYLAAHSQLTPLLAWLKKLVLVYIDEDGNERLPLNNP